MTSKSKVIYVLSTISVLMLVIVIVRQSPWYREYRAKSVVETFLSAAVKGREHDVNNLNRSGKTFYHVFDYNYLKTLESNKQTKRPFIAVNFSNPDKATICNNSWFSGKSNDEPEKAYFKRSIFVFAITGTAPEKLGPSITEEHKKKLNEVKDLMCETETPFVAMVHIVLKRLASAMFAITPRELNINAELLTDWYSVKLEGLSDAYAYKFSYLVNIASKGGIKLENRWNFGVVNHEGEYFIEKIEDAGN